MSQTNTTEMTKLFPRNGDPILKESLSKTARVTEASEPRSLVPSSHRARLLNRANHRNAEMFVIWSFMFFSFGALFFCLWAIAAKCHGNWPF